MMTADELRTERFYRLNERLGILNDGRAPEAIHWEIASAEVEAWVAAQKEQKEFWWEKE